MGRNRKQITLDFIRKIRPAVDAVLAVVESAIMTKRRAVANSPKLCVICIQAKYGGFKNDMKEFSYLSTSIFT